MSKVPKKKTEEVLAEVNKSVSDLVDIVRGVADRVSSLEKAPVTQVTPAIFETPSVISDSGNPKIRHFLDSILNKRFGFRVESSVNPASFKLIVLVPKEYSDAPQGYWDMYHEDPRQAEVDIARGDDGIKECIERVFGLFNPSIQGLIIADRQSPFNPL